MFKKYFTLFILFLALSSCNSSRQEKIIKKNVNDENIFFEYAIYFLDGKPTNLEDYRKNIEKKFPTIKIKKSLSKFSDIKENELFIKEINNVKDSFTAPDLEYLKYISKGLSDQDKNNLQDSKFVLLFDFMCKEKDLHQVMKDANKMVLEYSKNFNGLIWDSETREIFSTNFWEENRMIKSSPLDIRKHITIHMYKTDDYCRAITLGMSKFGLPDICVENLSCYNESVGNLINLTAQTLLEKQQINKGDKLMLDVKQLKNKEFKDFLIKTSYENALGSSEVNIVDGKRQEGDPENRIFELSFSKENPQIQHDELIKNLFGSKDEVTNVSHNDKILAASKKAKEKAPELKEKFQKGLPVGTNLLLKFPFNYGKDNDEWMWVEVVKWEGDKIKGILQNEPYYIKSLKAGQEVTKDISLMFDYILYLPDGSSEGNETGELIRQQQN